MPAAHVPVLNEVPSARSIDSFLTREIDVGSFPSASYVVGSPRGIEIEGAVGHAVAVPLRVPATVETVYDCASITKPLITTTLILLAVAEHQITLDDRFQGFTYRELLTHTSGREPGCRCMPTTTTWTQFSKRGLSTSGGRRWCTPI